MKSLMILVPMVMLLGAGCTEPTADLGKTKAADEIRNETSDFDKKVSCSKYVAALVKRGEEMVADDKRHHALNSEVCFSKRLNTCVGFTGSWYDDTDYTFRSIEDVLTNKSIGLYSIPSSKVDSVQSSQVQREFENMRDELECI